MLYIIATSFCFFILLSTVKTAPAARFLVPPAVLLPFCPPGLAIPHTHPRALSDASPKPPPRPNLRPPTVLAPPIVRHPNTTVVCVSATRIGVLIRRKFHTLIFRFLPFFRLIGPAPREFFFVWAIFSSASNPSSPHLYAVGRTATPAASVRFADAISRFRDLENPHWPIDASSPRPQYVCHIILFGYFRASPCFPGRSPSFSFGSSRRTAEKTIDEFRDAARVPVAPSLLSSPDFVPGTFIPLFSYAHLTTMCTSAPAQVNNDYGPLL
ncbi:hypothetical protein C8J57DRAFT_1546033 [Mycena rebaudengoi]|nr:hypothetical protein C8J57DRAFT_1546033 [Mycena rebaudengoi]